MQKAMRHVWFCASLWGLRAIFFFSRRPRGLTQKEQTRPTSAKICGAAGLLFSLPQTRRLTQKAMQHIWFCENLRGLRAILFFPADLAD